MKKNTYRHYRPGDFGTQMRRGQFADKATALAGIVQRNITSSAIELNVPAVTHISELKEL
jgi:hypothetical protein